MLNLKLMPLALPIPRPEALVAVTVPLAGSESGAVPDQHCCCNKALGAFQLEVEGTTRKLRLGGSHRAASLSACSSFSLRFCGNRIRNSLTFQAQQVGPLHSHPCPRPPFFDPSSFPCTLRSSLPAPPLNLSSALSDNSRQGGGGAAALLR